MGGASNGSSESESDERPREARLLIGMIRTMLLVGVSAYVVSLFDPANDVFVGSAFYLPIFALLAALDLLARRGHQRSVAWVLSIFFWALMVLVTTFFGGLRGQNAAVFAVSIVLAGTLVGGRAALVLAVLSSVWVWALALLEHVWWLPTPLAPYSVVNSATALTITFILLSVLVRTSLDSLRALNERVRQSAQARDDALRRSIEAQKLHVIGGLANGIAHDFNNLLTVIGSAGEVLRTHVRPDDVDAKEILDDLDGATVRAALMTRQLLSFGRPEQSKLTSVDISAVARGLEPMLPRLLGPRITVRVEAVEGAAALATRAGIEQVLLNLAVNARDAMPTGGRLTIAVGTDGERVTLRVEDTGIGMDEATVKQVFQAFFTTKPNGTGLGLATVRDLVTRYDGSIDVRSAAGQGTTFTLGFPRVLVPIEHVTPARPAVHAAGARLLLVEDDSLVRRSFQRVLEAAAFDVVSVADGLEAQGLLERVSDFSVVVSDISMPGLDGDSLARRLARERPDLRLVLVSGNRTPSPETMASPRRAFLDKPVSEQALLAAIERVRSAPPADAEPGLTPQASAT